MKVTKNLSYYFEDSFDRLDEILDTPAEFEELDEIPDSDKLTYRNGYYLNCYAIFIDIRDSSKLPDKYQRKTLAKIYRAFISEITAIFQSFSNCKEINIVGDSVWGVFDSTCKDDVLEVFSAAYTSQSLINTLNYKLCRRNIDPINIGIGISKGRALMIQAGFKGSGINDVIWMGHVVNQASKMCSKANKEVTFPLVIGENVYKKLSGYKNTLGVKFQDFFYYHRNGYYYSNVFRVDMDEWLKKKQKDNPCSR